MGIGLDIMRALVREAAIKPITGTVLTLGRQTIFATPAQAKTMLKNHGITPAVDDEELDVSTKQTLEENATRISDKAFFRMLGAEKVTTLDVSDYEGADIVHNLNVPIPDQYEGIADFIVDGSTLDNVWNPVTGLLNVGRMLRPGGRAIMTNRGNAGGPGIAYMMFSAPWFFDYFVANNFTDCQVFSTAYDGARRVTYMMSPEAAMRKWGNGRIQSLETTNTVGVTIFAEKGDASTWDQMPTQASYRGDREWEVVKPRVESLLAGGRPPLLRGDDGPDLDSESVRYGWWRVMPDGTLVWPRSGLKKTADHTLIHPDGRRVPALPEIGN